MPFVVVGDEAFRLSKRILRPFPRKNLSVVKKVLTTDILELVEWLNALSEF